MNQNNNIEKATAEAKKKSEHYCFRGMCIPNYMMEGLTDYINEGVPPGSFLAAVIDNNLRIAVGRADDENIRVIPAYIAYLSNEAPIGCWGRPEAVTEWVKYKREERDNG